MNELEHVVIIGGGLAGLAAAYDLVKKGFAITLLESAAELGGLASSFEMQGVPLERFYHFVCRADTELVQLVAELGIQAQLHWRQTRTSFFYSGRLYSFGTPFDLLRFSPVPVTQRLRFGLNVLQSRYLRDWRKLDDVAAKDWLIASIGKEAYTVIWDPLLRVKFGEFHDQISAAWMWHRIWRVARSRRRLWERESFGYLEQGSATLVNALLAKIQEYPNVQVRRNARVTKIALRDGRAQSVQLQNGETIACDSVVSTVPLPAFVELAPDLPPSYLSARSRRSSISASSA